MTDGARDSAQSQREIGIETDFPVPAVASTSLAPRARATEGRPPAPPTATETIFHGLAARLDIARSLQPGVDPNKLFQGHRAEFSRDPVDGGTPLTKWVLARIDASRLSQEEKRKARDALGKYSPLGITRTVVEGSRGNEPMQPAGPSGVAGRAAGSGSVKPMASCPVAPSASGQRQPTESPSQGTRQTRPGPAGPGAPVPGNPVAATPPTPPLALGVSRPQVGAKAATALPSALRRETASGSGPATREKLTGPVVNEARPPRDTLDPASSRAGRLPLGSPASPHTHHSGGAAGVATQRIAAPQERWVGSVVPAPPSNSAGLGSRNGRGAPEHEHPRWASGGQAAGGALVPPGVPRPVAGAAGYPAQPRGPLTPAALRPGAMPSPPIAGLVFRGPTGQLQLRASGNSLDQVRRYRSPIPASSRM